MTERLEYQLDPPSRPLGMIVLQSDETVELDTRFLFPPRFSPLVSRVPSGDEVTPQSLAGMEQHLTGAARLFPSWARFSVLGYACTSGTAQIGAEAVAERIRAGAPLTGTVTEPVSALIAAARAMGLSRLGLVSPYLEPVSERLRAVLAEAGIATPSFGSFDVPEEALVARIGMSSIRRAAEDVAAQGGNIDGIFLSCTNLRTLPVIRTLEATLRLPVLSSNQVLAWHMMHLAGIEPPAQAIGDLFRYRP